MNVIEVLLFKVLQSRPKSGSSDELQGDRSCDIIKELVTHDLPLRKHVKSIIHNALATEPEHVHKERALSLLHFIARIETYGAFQYHHSGPQRKNCSVCSPPKPPPFNMDTHTLRMNHSQPSVLKTVKNGSARREPDEMYVERIMRTDTQDPASLGNVQTEYLRESARWHSPRASEGKAFPLSTASGPPATLYDQPDEEEEADEKDLEYKRQIVALKERLEVEEQALMEMLKREHTLEQVQDRIMTRLGHSVFSSRGRLFRAWRQYCSEKTKRRQLRIYILDRHHIRKRKQSVAHVFHAWRNYTQQKRDSPWSVSTSRGGANRIVRFQINATARRRSSLLSDALSIWRSAVGVQKRTTRAFCAAVLRLEASLVRRVFREWRAIAVRNKRRQVERRLDTVERAFKVWLTEREHLRLAVLSKLCKHSVWRLLNLVFHRWREHILVVKEERIRIEQSAQRREDLRLSGAFRSWRHHLHERLQKRNMEMRLVQQLVPVREKREAFEGWKAALGLVKREQEEQFKAAVMEFKRMSEERQYEMQVELDRRGKQQQPQQHSRPYR
mmetsp:Transcript_50795/g.84260  ORF Transcript_50795/g.84260 Transcript_50795/m.84260 type:complete len:558 (+) Transcript_50795:62-1735(+)